MNKITIPVGLIIGAFSWGVVSLISDKFEPFDNEIGFYTGQVMLSSGALYFGYKEGFKTVLIYLICAYIGMNSYAYIFCGDETRAWFELGLITTLILLFYPLVSGIIGKLAQYAQTSYNSAFNHDV